MSTAGESSFFNDSGEEDDDRNETSSYHSLLLSHINALTVLKSYGVGSLHSEVYIPALGVSAFLKETIKTGLEVSSVMTQQRTTDSCRQFRTDYTWVELQFLPYYTLATHVYGTSLPYHLLDLLSLHRFRMLIVCKLYSGHLTAEGEQDLLRYVRDNYSEKTFKQFQFGADMQSIIKEIGKQEFRSAEVEKAYYNLSYTGKKLFRGHHKFLNRAQCLRKLKELKDAVEVSTDNDFIDRINSIPSHLFHPCQMVQHLPDDFLKREAEPYLSEAGSVLIEHLRNSSATAELESVNPDDIASSKRHLQKYFANLSFNRQSSWVGLADILVMKYTLALMVEDDVKEVSAMLSAHNKVKAAYSPSADEYFSSRDMINDCLDTIMTIASRDFKDPQEVQYLCSTLKDTEPSEALVMGVYRLKGLLWEMIACDRYGVDYIPETQKPTMEVLIRSVWGPEALDTLRADNMTRLGLSLTPDAVRVHQPGSILYDPTMRQIKDFVSRPENKSTFATTLFTVTYSETASSTGGSPNSSASQLRDMSNGVVNIPEPELEGKPIIEIMEFGWVRDTGGKTRNDEAKWLRTVCSLLLSGFPVILTTDIRDSRDAIWSLPSLKPIRRTILKLQESAETAAGPFMTYNLSIDRSQWHHEKSARKMGISLPPDLSRQIERSKKRLRDCLVDEEGYLTEEDAGTLFETLSTDKAHIWDDQTIVNRGVEFLSRVFTSDKITAKKTRITSRSLEEFERGFQKENRDKNPGDTASRNRTVESLLFLGELDKQMWADSSVVRAASNLDRLMNATYPSALPSEKKFRRLMHFLSLRLAHLSGVYLVSMKSGNLEVTDKTGNGKYVKLGQQIFPAAGEFKEDKFRDNCQGVADCLRDRTLTLIRAVVSDIREGATPHHYCKRSPEVLDELKNDNHGILKVRADVLKRRLKARITPTMKTEDGFVREDSKGSTPTMEECFRALDDIKESMSVTPERVEEFKNLITDSEIKEALLQSGFSEVSRDVMDRALTLLCSIKFFQRLIIFQEICRCFLSLYKRKKSNLITETRVRSTNGRLYLKRQRNYREAFDIAYVNDDGTGYVKMRLNQKLGMLGYALPSMLVSIFIMNFQECLLAREASLDRFATLFSKAVEDYDNIAREHLEDSYVDPGSTCARKLNISDSSEEETMARGAVGLLYTAMFRLHPSQDNNTIASMSRYAIMYNWSQFADSEGLGKKLVNKCTNVWDYIEMALVRYMFKLKFVNVNSFKPPNCYHLGFNVPQNSNVAVSCMYYHHMYVRLLGDRAHANNNAHKSYLDTELLTREALDDEDFDTTTILGNDNMYELFETWSANEGSAEAIKAVEEAATILEANQQLPSKQPVYSRFVVELAAAGLRNELGSTPFVKLQTSKNVNKTLTEICEPNSVISSFKKSGTIESIVDAVVGDMDRAVQNTRTEHAIERAKQLFQTDDEVKDLITNNPAHKDLLENINRSILESSQIFIPARVAELGSKPGNFPNSLLENRVSVIKIAKQVSARRIRVLRDLKRGRKLEDDHYSEDCVYTSDNTVLLETLHPLACLGELKLGDEETLKELELLELKCEEFMNFFKAYIRVTAEEPDVNRVDIKAILMSLEPEIDREKTVLYKAFIILMQRVAVSRMYYYEWLKKKNKESIKARDVALSKTQIKSLFANFPNTFDYVSRVYLTNKPLTSLLDAREDILAASSLEMLSERITSMLGVTPTADVAASILSSLTEMMLRKTSYSLRKAGLAGSSAYASARSTSLEMMGAIIRSFNETSLFQVAMRVLSGNFEFLLGVAPKAQMMSVRELGILEIQTKIVMAFFESVMGHILKFIPSDLLENPKKKNEVLNQAGQWMREQSEGICSVLSTSGDRSKWAPKHSYLSFYLFFKTLLRESSFSQPIELICLEGLRKKLEIPTSSINAVMKTLLNLTSVKSKSLNEIKKAFVELFTKLKTMPIAAWNHYNSIEEIEDGECLLEFLDQYDEWGESYLEIAELEFDWGTSLDMCPPLFMLKFLSLGLTPVQLHVCHMLSHGRLYTTMFTHMIQGIPHRGSSVVHNALLKLAVKVHAKSEEMCDWSVSSQVEFVTSSDDYFMMMKAPDSVARHDFERSYMLLDRIQCTLANSVCIVDSAKTVVSSYVAEVYSSFETGNRTNMPLIKLVQNHLPGEQTTPLQHNLEEITRMNQFVDFSATECDLYAYILLKHSRIKESTGVKSDLYQILQYCSGVLNPFVSLSYHGALSHNAETGILTTSWTNHQWLEKHFKSAKGDMKLFFTLLSVDQTFTETEKLRRLTAYLLDGVAVDPRCGRGGKVTSGNKNLDNTKLREPFSMPYSKKLKLQKEKLGESKPTHQPEVSQAYSMAARGGITNIVGVEESRLVQALSSPKLEIKMSRIFEDSGYAMLRYFLNAHCVVIDPDHPITKHMVSWRLLSSEKNSAVVKIAKTKFRLCELVSACLGVAAAMLNMPGSTEVPPDKISDTVLSVLFKKKKPQPSTEATPTKQPTAPQERQIPEYDTIMEEESVDSTPQTPDDRPSTSSSVNTAEGGVIDDMTGAVSKIGTKFRKRRKRRAVGSPRLTQPATPVKVVFEEPADPPPSEDKKEEPVGPDEDEDFHMTDDIDPKIVSDAVSVEEAWQLYKRVRVCCGDVLNGIDGGEMKYLESNRQPKLVLKRRVPPDETVIVTNMHYNQRDPSKLANNWALIAVHMLHPDVVRTLELPFDNYSAVYRDIANVISQVGSAPKEPGLKQEYFARVEAAFATQGASTRHSYIRGTSRDSTLFGSSLVQAVSRNVCEGWVVELSLNLEGLTQEEGESSMVCQTVATMASSCDLRDGGSGKLINCLNRVVDTMKIVGNRTIRDIVTTHLSSRSEAPRDLVNITAICSGNVGSNTKDSQVIKICETKLLYQKALVSTDGVDSVIFIESEGVLITSVKDVSTLTPLLSNLWSHVFGFEYPRNSGDRGIIATAVTISEKARKVISLPKLYLRMEKDGSYRRVNNPSGTNADIECYVDSSRDREVRVISRGDKLSEYSEILTVDEGGIAFEHTYENVEMSTRSNAVRFALIRMALEEGEALPDTVTEGIARDRTMRQLKFKSCVVKARRDIKLKLMLQVLASCKFQWPKEKPCDNPRELLAYMSSRMFSSQRSLVEDHTRLTAFVTNLKADAAGTPVPRFLATKVSRLMCSVGSRYTKRTARGMVVSGRSVISGLKDSALAYFETLAQENSTLYKYLGVLCLGLSQRELGMVVMDVVKPLSWYHELREFSELTSAPSYEFVTPLIEGTSLYIRVDNETMYIIPAEDDRCRWLRNCLTMISMIVSHLKGFGPMTVPTELSHGNQRILSTDIHTRRNSLSVTRTTFRKLADCVSGLGGEQQGDRMIIDADEVLTKVISHLFGQCYYDMSACDERKDFTEKEKAIHGDKELPVSRRGWPEGRLWKKAELAKKCLLSKHFLGTLSAERADDLVRMWLRKGQVFTQEPAALSEMESLRRECRRLENKISELDEDSKLRKKLVAELSRATIKLVDLENPASEGAFDANDPVSVYDDLLASFKAASQEGFD
ncbi:RNA-dependent RNA polymerase [Beihai shrimp virus 3]|uniref:RNA-dependent RNA polymerase n=1 Tax=Beihai shrimp virus 3 TaxID=1922669 RepID=UPI000909BFB4|nr:RNA-dependent RNA polymerase [Beihai shrimp virus 3]APG79220.1 RNA-dependent RNA polymerase [Beihai shrimp virus 3]APG79239.1 RNA-dependent RNA polymerase [Beihai shrimp virus 3]